MTVTRRYLIVSGAIIALSAGGTSGVADASRGGDERNAPAASAGHDPAPKLTQRRADEPAGRADDKA
jgi:hypothetical protein